MTGIRILDPHTHGPASGWESQADLVPAKETAEEVPKMEPMLVRQSQAIDTRSRYEDMKWLPTNPSSTGARTPDPRRPNYSSVGWSPASRSTRVDSWNDTGSSAMGISRLR
jgi:hypothetical protein